ncbi:MAG TPA: endonuclease/exonuclease/phosphatase family protein [Candidatus Acidoferrales bacterium]
MAKAFSLASWNVEHFKDDPNRVGRVVDFLRRQDADVFTLYEVEGKTVFQQLVSKLPAYQFHITEGPQVQEILVGVRSGLTAFFTQRLEFKSGNSLLRPGALLTLRIDSEDYPILFLHTKSGSKPIGLGIRDDMFAHAFKLKKKLDQVAGGQGKAKFLFLGDLNTMGMEYPFQKDISPTLELQKLDREAAKAKMRRLTKNREYTWSNGPQSKMPPANLDHVVASEQLRLRPFGGKDIEVRGWPAEATAERQADWIRKFSDHALLFLEVQKG